MAKAISLHIGVNSVDPAHYGGWTGDLGACEFDAKDMSALAQRQGIETRRILLTSQATSAAVILALRDAAKALVKGDLFFMTYSGHGGQLPDTNGDEADRMDETWVLYDRELLDDELYDLYAQFKPGVRLLVLSDSCHSGTVTRAVPRPGDNEPVGRMCPHSVSQKAYKAHRSLYDGLQKALAPSTTVKVRATVLLISGCQDNQLSLDGQRNGLFTGTLKKVWNGGKFNGGYRAFRDTIVSKMPPTQTPNYYVIGAANPAFESQKPFTV